MTLPLSGSFNSTNLQVTSGSRANPEEEIDSGREFASFVSDLDRPQAQWSKNPAHPESYKNPAINPGFEMLNWLGEMEPLDPLRRGVPTSSQEGPSPEDADCAPEGIRTPPETIINILPTALLQEQIQASVTCATSIDRGVTEGDIAGCSAPVKDKERQTDVIPSEIGGKMSVLGANIAMASGEGSNERAEPRYIDGDIGDHPLNGGVKIGTDKFSSEINAISSKSSSATFENKNIPVMKLHISEVTSHFPAILVQSLLGQQRLSAQDGFTPNVAPTLSIADTRIQTQNQPERVRILRFELEPAELGAVHVKMRISEHRVAIAIEAQSISTSDLLRNSRDILSTAIEHNGLSLHAFDVATQVEPAQTKPSIGGEFRGPGEGGNGSDGGRGGFLNDERSRQEGRQSEQFKAGKTHALGSDDVDSGILL